MKYPLGWHFIGILVLVSVCWFVDTSGQTRI